MIDAIKFRELVEAYDADTHSNTNAYLYLSHFLLSHADALLALVEADAKRHEIARAQQIDNAAHDAWRDAMYGGEKP